MDLLVAVLNIASWTRGKTTISVDAKLDFSAQSFDGKKYVTMNINEEYGSVKFTPASVFYKPASFRMTIEGLDLEGINPDDVRFVYQTEDGNIETIKTANVMVDRKRGY